MKFSRPRGKTSLCMAFMACVIGAVVLSCANPSISAGGQSTVRAAAASDAPFDIKANRLTGVNWFGFETSSYVLHGLWSRDYKSVLKQVKDLGFNTLRLPWCDAMIGKSPNGIQINKDGVDAYTGIRGMNADLEGLSSLEVLDKVIAEANRLGLYIILDNHSKAADGYMNETLWYTAAVSEEQWIADWIMMVNRYKSYPNVIAADLKNEPHGNNGQGSKPPAAWGYDMSGYPHTDWRAAAVTCGNAIVAANPRMLIIVEGVEEYKGETYWWGGNLKGVRDYPITEIPDANLVYSAHEYGPEVYPQAWFTDAAFPGNMRAIWDANFWFISKEMNKHLFFGEFGIKESSASDPSSIAYQWMDNFMRYCGATSSWTFWALNPNSGDTGGILKDDWVSVNSAKYNMIKPYLAGGTPPSPTPTPTPTSTPTPTPTPTATPTSTPVNGVKVTYTKNDWGSGFTGVVKLTNNTNAPVNNWKVVFSFAGNQSVTQSWNVILVQSGKTVTCTGDWNKTIAANSSVEFGFNAAYSGTNADPVNFTVTY
jgi:endoglucanase